MRSLIVPLLLSFSAMSFAVQPEAVDKSGEAYKFAFKHVTTTDGTKHHLVSVLANNKVSTALISINRSGFNPKDFVIDGYIDQVKLFANPELRARLDEHVAFYKRNEPNGEFAITYPASGGANLAVKSKKGQSIIADFNNFTAELSNEILTSAFHISVNPDTNVADVDYEFTITSQAPYLGKFAYALIAPVFNSSRLEQLSYLLNFVQGITYDTPLDNSFRTPLAVLDDEMGDCDEKSVLLAALLKSAMPNSMPALLVIKTKRGSHAIAVAEWPYDHPNRMLIDGKPYIAMETTDKFPVGIVPDEVLDALKAGRYYMIRL